MSVGSRCWVAVAAGGAVAALVASRLALVWRFPPFIDEGTFARWTLTGYEDAAERFLPLAGGNHPMQEWLGMALVSVGLEPLTSLRLLSVASGLVLLGVVAVLAYELGGRDAALASLLVWVVLPFSLVYGVIGLADPLVAACFGVAMVVQARLARAPTLGAALMLGVVWGVGLLTKLTMTAALWLVPLGLLLVDWGRDSLAARLVRWIASVALAALIAAALYQVLRLTPLYGGADEAREIYFTSHGIGEFLDMPGRWIRDNWTSYRLAYRGYLTIPLVLAAAVGFAVVVRRDVRLGLFALGWAVLPVAAVVALADEPYVRWLYVAVAPLAAFVSVGVAAIGRWVGEEVGRRAPTWHRPAVAATVCALVLPAVVWDVETLGDPVGRVYPGHDDVDYVLDFSAGGPWSAVARELERIPGPTRVATSGQAFDNLALSLRDRPLELADVGERVAHPTFVLGIENKGMLAPGPGSLAWEPARTFERPRDGVPVRMARRVVRLSDGTATTPRQLESRLGSPQATRRFLAEHPEVRAWARAWEQAYSPG